MNNTGDLDSSVIHGISDNCRMSEALYMGLCDYIGTPTEVTVRRKVMDMDDMIGKPVQIYKGLRRIMSGSYREGFRLTDSDIDMMFWLINHKVITDRSQSSAYNLLKHSIILMKDTDTPSGFVRLRFLTSPSDECIVSSVVPFSGKFYISSSRWRQIMLTWMSGHKSFNNTKSHGPCANGFIGVIEADCALCFHSSYWSRLTCYWKKRCTLHTWPLDYVFDDILRNGCHFVPVGSKFAGVENEVDWRLSFSQAEQKLVYSMNHTQFVCYGLLKIFFKEVVNRDKKEPFLCSYFVKTTMFWLIQIVHITWCPNTLLNSFWKCFKYLLHCVHRGVLPNFFIPQNNMFASKLSTVKGTQKRECLMRQLNRYYNMGLTCLLQSPTVKAIIEKVESISFVQINPLLGHIMDITDKDNCINMEILYELEFDNKNLMTSYLYLKTIPTLLHIKSSQYQKLSLQNSIAKVLVTTAFKHIKSSLDCTIKKAYISERLIANMLKLAGRVGNASSFLYLALYYYRTSRYREALHVTALVKSKITEPYIMYSTVNRESYNECVAGWSLSKRMKKAWADRIRLHTDVYYIKELILEQKTGKETDIPFLNISPYVIADMLRVLCYHRLGNRSQCLQSLIDLQTLLLYDDRKYVTSVTGDISWQILGICQHVVGDLHGALQSYQVSLRQRPTHKLQEATQYRITLVLNQLN